jgi:hypothetical protein
MEVVSVSPPLIFAVVVKNNFDRAMLFLRVQEYSESPNRRFRGHPFKLEDYIKWYSVTNGNGQFTYPQDWAGFNVTMRKCIDCYSELPPDDWNDYDIIFCEMLRHLIRLGATIDTYIIGVDGINTRTYRHELIHAHFSTDKEYRKKVRQEVRKLPKKVSDILRRNLINMGYHDSEYVIVNEIQAYLLGPDWNMTNFSKGVPLKKLRRLRSKIKKNLC